MGRGRKKRADPVYAVETVLSAELRGGSVWYFLTLWQGYSHEEATWEPESSFEGANDEMMALLAREKRAAAKRGRGGRVGQAEVSAEVGAEVGADVGAEVGAKRMEREEEESDFS